MKKLPALALAAGLVLTGTPVYAIGGHEAPAPGQSLADYMGGDRVTDAEDWDRVQTWIDANYGDEEPTAPPAPPQPLPDAPHVEPTEPPADTATEEPADGPSVTDVEVTATEDNTIRFTGKVTGTTEELTFRASAWEFTDQAGYPAHSTPAEDGTVSFEVTDFNNTDPKHWQLEVGGSTWTHGEVIDSGDITQPAPVEDTTEEAPQAPAEDTATDVVPASSDGQGGEYTDRRSVTFSGAGRTSQYHVWAGHIDPSQPVGLMVHLHGDGGYEFRSPTSGVPAAYLNIAKANNAILVVPKTPNSDNTWWTDRTASDWLAALVEDIQGDYPINTADTWLSGFSGGSQALTQHFIPTHHDLFTGGGAVITGGGTPGRDLSAVAAEDGDTFEMHFVAGTADTGGSGSNYNGFNAYRAAQSGADAYRSAGFNTVSFTEIPGDTHNASANDGPIVMERERN